MYFSNISTQMRIIKYMTYFNICEKEIKNLIYIDGQCTSAYNQITK